MPELRLTVGIFSIFLSFLVLLESLLLTIHEYILFQESICSPLFYAPWSPH